MYQLNNPFLATLLNISAEGVIIQDHAGRIVFTNTAANRLLDLDADTIAGGTTRDLARRIVREDGSPFPEAEHPGIRAMQTGRPSVGVVMGVERDGGRPTTWLNVNAAKVVDPSSGASLVFTLFADITAPIENAHHLNVVTDQLRQSNDALRAALSNLETLTNEFHQLSQTDPLTGLANRRAFDDAMEAERRRQHRSKETAALLMIDIDHFKNVNDTYGHDAGDHALVELARVLRTTVRTTDLPARFGGEEFVVLLTATQEAGAADMAERIRVAVERLRIRHPAGDVRLTVSIGVAAIPPEGPGWADAVTRADHAMYRAKERGRNRVESAENVPAMA